MNAHLNRHYGTERQLKEALYEEAIDLFDSKDMWEEAILIIKELESEYGSGYEYAKLSQLLVMFQLILFYADVFLVSTLCFIFDILKLLGLKNNFWAVFLA